MVTDRIDIRRADVAEAQALHELSIRSKAHWGYGADFMRRAAPKLALPSHWFTAGRVFVAEVDGQRVGVAAVTQPDDQGVAELEHLFVDPAHMGRGVGTALLAEAVALAKSEGAGSLRLLSDPQARPFYELRGFRWVSDAPSDAIPGRQLPMLLLRI